LRAFSGNDVVELDDPTARQSHRLLDHVLELAVLPGYSYATSASSSPRAGARGCASCGCISREKNRPAWDVFAPVAQGRELKARDVEPVVKILAKRFSAWPAPGLVRGGDDRTLTWTALFSPSRLNLTLLGCGAAAWPERKAAFREISSKKKVPPSASSKSPLLPWRPP